MRERLWAALAWSLVFALVLIDDGEVGGEVLHVVSVAFMRGGERRRRPGETVCWAGPGLRLRLLGRLLLDCLVGYMAR
jgi:hypothetical protein